MDRNEAEILMPVIKAFCEGKAIQKKKKPTGAGTNKDGWTEFNDWEDCKCHNLDLENYDYRIKPTPTYRPFADGTPFGKLIEE